MTIHTSPSLRAKSILTHQLPPPPTSLPSTPCPRCPPLSRFFHLPFSAAWVGRTPRERCRKQESDLLNRETQSSKRGAHNSFFYSALKLMVHVWQLSNFYSSELFGFSKSLSLFFASYILYYLKVKRCFLRRITEIPRIKVY